MADENVDIVLLQGELPRTPNVRNRNFEEINDLAPGLPKPLAYFSIVSHSVSDHGREYRRQLPNYALLQGADKALRAARSVGDYFVRKTRAVGGVESLSPTARQVFDRRPDQSRSLPDVAALASGVLDEPSARRLLAQYGLAGPRDAVAASADEATAAAGAMGFPVVLKVIADGITHKTEVGGVKLDLRNAQEVKAAFDEIRSALAAQAPAAAFRGVLVSEQIRPGLEVILGLQHDADMGPVVMLGPGGTAVEWVRKVAFSAVPVSPLQMGELFEDAGIAPFLGGFRGGMALDRDALAEAILCLSDLALDIGASIETIEVNPLAVLPRGQGVRVLDALIVGSSRGS
jgi:acetate---CoA ligase (ADP-forming)